MIDRYGKTGAVIAIVIVLGALPLTVLAAPASLSMSGDTTSPGGEATVTFEVTNTGDTDSEYGLRYAIPDGWDVKSHSGGDVSDEANQEFGWITVEPGETVTAEATLTVPDDEGPGEYTVSATVEDANEVQDSRSTTVTVESDSTPTPTETATPTPTETATPTPTDTETATETPTPTDDGGDSTETATPTPTDDGDGGDTTSTPTDDGSDDGDSTPTDDGDTTSDDSQDGSTTDGSDASAGDDTDSSTDGDGTSDGDDTADADSTADGDGSDGDGASADGDRAGDTATGTADATSTADDDDDSLVAGVQEIAGLSGVTVLVLLGVITAAVLAIYGARVVSG